MSQGNTVKEEYSPCPPLTSVCLYKGPCILAHSHTFNTSVGTGTHPHYFTAPHRYMPIEI